ncbi:UNVERIFIED_CONTAM: hypothetical protein FKN15_032384 [Acipenser sinensis]
MSPIGNDCPHLESVGEITKEELIQKSHGKCQDCKVGGPNLWACLEVSKYDENEEKKILMAVPTSAVENLTLITARFTPRYGGGPAVNHLYVCHTCQTEIEKLEKRRKIELDMFVRLNKAFQEEEAPAVIYCISMQWFREWEGFVKGKDNGADSGQISEETWNFLHSIYGGGPEVTLRPNIAHQESETSQAEEKIEMETRAV